MRLSCAVDQERLTLYNLFFEMMGFDSSLLSDAEKRQVNLGIVHSIDKNMFFGLFAFVSRSTPSNDYYFIRGECFTDAVFTIVYLTLMEGSFKAASAALASAATGLMASIALAVTGPGLAGELVVIPGTMAMAVGSLAGYAATAHFSVKYDHATANLADSTLRLQNARNRIPVKDTTRASNGLDYQSNPKHTPGQPGYRQNAGVEPHNSLDLFNNSVPSTVNSNQRYTYDKVTDTLHRFFNDGNGTWHWSGSTNQGANSLTSGDVPIDIRRLFDLPGKGW